MQAAFAQVIPVEPRSSISSLIFVSFVPCVAVSVVRGLFVVMAGETPASVPPAAEGGAPLDGVGVSPSGESPDPAPSGSTGGATPHPADRVAEPTDAGSGCYRARSTIPADD